MNGSSLWSCPKATSPAFASPRYWATSFQQVPLTTTNVASVPGEGHGEGAAKSLPSPSGTGAGGEGASVLPSIANAPEASGWLHEHGLLPFLDEVRNERLSELDRIAEHIEMSLTELLQKTDEEIGKAATEVEHGAQGAEGRLAQAETRHGDLLARRDRRRQELQQQRSLTLQAVERITTVLVLPHPERNSPEVRRLQPNPETEAIAMRVAMEHERAQGRQVYDVHEKNLGYDLTSLDLNSGELRLIEVKGIGDTEGMVVLTPHEYEVAEDRRDCYWLYVVTDCNASPRLTTIRDPAAQPWQPVRKAPTLHARFVHAAKGGPIRRQETWPCPRGKTISRRRKPPCPRIPNACPPWWPKAKAPRWSSNALPAS